MGIHLLPFSPSQSTDGFAPNDWFEVDPKFGSWGDIRQLAKERFLVVDGIYNHVGLGHWIAKSFFDAPDKNIELVHAYKGARAKDIGFAPRGGPAVKHHRIAGTDWQVWQTFIDQGVDIRLKTPRIQDEVRRHLRQLSSVGVRGVRLDAVSYYGKPLDGAGTQLHHPDAIGLARLVESWASAEGLVTIAQLDCDSRGLRYFPKAESYDVPVVDYSFSAHLALALCNQNIISLVDHINETALIPEDLIRAPRTHDGILMRSPLLADGVRDQLAAFAERCGIAVRVVDGVPYELNCSLPFLCSEGGERVDLVEARLEVALAISGFVSGWTYLYLPAIAGYSPEFDGTKDQEADPRALNRTPIPMSAWERFLGSSLRSTLVELATVIDEFKVASVARDESERARALSEEVLSIEYPKSRVRLCVNLNPDQETRIDFPSGRMLFGRRIVRGGLGPLGFGIWEP
jgi:hypothetical protein